MPPPSRRRAARFPVSLAIFAAATIGFAAYTAVSGRDDGHGNGSPPAEDVRPLERSGSEALDRPADDLPLGAGPATYTVTYEVREPGRPVTRQTIAVERPYRSRRTTATDVTVTSFGRLQVVPRDGEATIVSPPPAAVDPRPDLVVARALEEGLLDRREQRLVGDERCQVFRARSPISSSTITAALPVDHTDICISAEGLVLEEWQVDDGRPVRHRLAVEVDPDADVQPVSGEPTLSAAQGGGSVLAVEATSRPEGRFYELATPPDGFTLRGRYSVVPPQAGLTDEKERRRAVASTADVFERGTDLLVVDRGSTLNLDAAFQPRPEGRPIEDIGPAFGGAAGELLLSWTGPEVRWGDDDGRFVRVYGTVPVDVLVETMRALRATEGGTGLVFTGAPI